MTDLSYQAEAMTYGPTLEADASSTPSRQLVQLSFSFNEECTRPSYPDLTDQVMVDLEGVLTERGLSPTALQLNALRAVVSTMSDMARGACPPRLMVSDLAPGMGKTTALILFLRHFIRSEDHQDVGVVVCLSLCDEIERLVEEAELPEDSFAVMWSDPDRPLPSSTEPDQAQVLFITQQMLASRCGTGSLKDCRDFHYLGQVRQVRVWDETMDPGKVVTLSTDDLGGLLGPVRPLNPDLADLISDLQGRLAAAPPNQLLTFPEILPSMRVSLPAEDDRKKQCLDSLYALSGGAVLVSKGGGNVRVALDTRDALPCDLAPALVLDASASVRGTYQLWCNCPDGPVRLPSAPKDYSPLTIHLMKKGAGKQAWQKGGEDHAREVATLIDSKPDERFLVVHHKARGKVDPVKLIKRYMTTDTSRVSFLHWGKHMATNAFRDVPNVILAGVLQLPESQHYGLAHASQGTAVSEPLEDEAVPLIADGEFAHAVLQATGRGVVRGCRDGRCPPCDLYVISPRRNAEQLLKAIFPGARVKPWAQKHKRPKGKALALITELEQSLEDAPLAQIYFTDLMDRLGIKDRSNFNKLCRHPDVAAALKRLNLKRVRLRASKGHDAFMRPFGNPKDVLGSDV